MRVLVFAPHPDDEVLGCGGTIAKRAATGDDVYVCIVTKGQPPLFDPEYIEQGRREDRQAAQILGVKDTIFMDYPAAMLDRISKGELAREFSELVDRIEPDEVYIPHRGDMHFDHVLTADAAMVAVRPKGHIVKRVYAYETLSETGWNIPNQQNEFIPNVYEDIGDHLTQKIAAMEQFKSQLCDYPSPRSLWAIDALARYRGCTVNTEYAEAFMLIREVKA